MTYNYCLRNTQIDNSLSRTKTPRCLLLQSPTITQDMTSCSVDHWLPLQLELQSFLLLPMCLFGTLVSTVSLLVSLSYLVIAAESTSSTVSSAIKKTGGAIRGIKSSWKTQSPGKIYHYQHIFKTCGEECPSSTFLLIECHFEHRERYNRKSQWITTVAEPEMKIREGQNVWLKKLNTKM